MWEDITINGKVINPVLSMSKEEFEKAAVLALTTDGKEATPKTANEMASTEDVSGETK